jgi:lipoprotein-anchoring transpeptidase ErfK/SrfK
MSNTLKSLSRRAFLAAMGSSLAAVALPKARTSAASSSRQPFQSTLPADPEWGFTQPHPARLDLWGRVTDYGSPFRNAAGGDANVIGFLPINTVLPLFEIVHAPGPANNPHNDVWYRIEQGYMYTSTVQVIEPYRMPVEITDIDTQIDENPGFWAEVIVPYTVARNAPSGAPMANDHDENVILTYSSVHHVIQSKPDDAGFLWYKVDDDKKDAKSFYVLARHMRRIAPEEITPINPDARDKRIEVSLDDQRLDCYEGDRLAMSTLVSSGGGGFATLKGEHAVVYKQISRHMYSDPEQEAFSDPNFFDLPGVPFNTFFTTLGHAIHGTYWHGDYGRPRSHGCLNVTPEAARWIWRWTDPPAPYSATAIGSSAEPGTPVTVV